MATPSVGSTQGQCFPRSPGSANTSSGRSALSSANRREDAVFLSILLHCLETGLRARAHHVGAPRRSHPKEGLACRAALLDPTSSDRRTTTRLPSRPAARRRRPRPSARRPRPRRRRRSLVAARHRDPGRRRAGAGLVLLTGAGDNTTTTTTVTQATSAAERAHEHHGRASTPPRRSTPGPRPASWTSPRAGLVRGARRHAVRRAAASRRDRDRDGLRRRAGPHRHRGARRRRRDCRSRVRFRTAPRARPRCSAGRRDRRRRAQGRRLRGDAASAGARQLRVPRRRRAVAAIGDPFGYERSLSTGIVSGVDRTIQSAERLHGRARDPDRRRDEPRQLRRPGARRRGQVIGIADQIATGQRRAELRRRLRRADRPRQARTDAARGRREGPPRLPRRRHGRQRPATAGALVRGSRGRPRGRAGLRAGDVVTASTGRRSRDSNDLVAAIADAQAGRQGRVTVRRGRRPQLTVTLGTQPTQPTHRPAVGNARRPP